jgi:uncharacterized YccA/Bax inhibitor family protein
MSADNQQRQITSTSNPAFSNSAFARATAAMPQTEPMTVAGTINRAIVLLAIVIGAAYVTWTATYQEPPPTWIQPALIASLIGGLVIAFVTIFKPNIAHITAPLYAVCEGALLGIISALFNQAYPGIVVQAVGATLGVFVVMLVLYRAGVIKVTQRFRMIIVGATFGILGFYLVTWIVSLFGVNTDMLFVSGPLAIGISVVIVIIAALNLALDFDFIEAGASAHAPARMEWYAAFGLLVTLIWLYLEILRLLAITRR